MRFGLKYLKILVHYDERQQGKMRHLQEHFSLENGINKTFRTGGIENTLTSSVY